MEYVEMSDNGYHNNGFTSIFSTVYLFSHCHLYTCYMLDSMFEIVIIIRLTSFLHLHKVK